MKLAVLGLILSLSPALGSSSRIEQDDSLEREKQQQSDDVHRASQSSVYRTFETAASASDEQGDKREGEFTFEFEMIPVSRRRREWTELDGTAVSRRSVAQV